MIVKDLMNDMDFDTHVKDTILKLYHGEIQRVLDGFYKTLWNELKSTPIIENTNSMTIHVQYVKEYEKADRWTWNVSYTLDRRYHHPYSLHFASKEQIVSAFVAEMDLEKQSVEEYLAHLLIDIARDGQMEEQEDGIGSVEPKNHLPHFADVAG